MCLFVRARCRKPHIHTCPRPCSSTCRWARLATHRHTGTTQLRSPCSHAHFGRATAACVSSPRDRAVSVGSHMQQDKTMYLVYPRLRASSSKTRFTTRTGMRKMAIASSPDNISCMGLPARVLRPFGRPRVCIFVSSLALPEQLFHCDPQWVGGRVSLVTQEKTTGRVPLPRREVMKLCIRSKTDKMPRLGTHPCMGLKTHKNQS